MKLFGGRVFVLVSAAFVAGAFFCAYIPGGIRGFIYPLLFALGIPLFVLGTVLRRKRISPRGKVPGYLTVTAAIMISFALSFLLCAVTVDRKINMAESLSGNEAECLFEITREGTSYSYYSSYDAVLVSADGERVDLGVKLEFNYATDFCEGDIISGTAELFLPQEDLYGYDLRDAYIADGIYLVAESDTSVTPEGRTARGIMYYVRYVHKVIGRALDSIFSDRDYGINKALLIGDKSDLPDSFVRDIRRLGLSHLLALSGMHLSIIVGGAEKFLTLVGVPKKVRCVFMIPAIVFYCAVTGFSGSVLRAGIMLIIYYTAFVFSRRYDSMTALFFSVASIVAVSPASARDVGLMLSFVTMLSIASLSGSANNRFARIGFIQRIPAFFRAGIFSCVHMTVSGFFAVLFALPLMWLYFTEASMVGVVLNLIVAPLIEVLMFLGVFALVFVFIPPISWGIAAINIKLTEIICDICEFFSKMRNITVSLNYPFTGIIFTVMLIGFIIILMLCVKRKAVYCTALGLSAVLIFAGCVYLYQTEFNKNNHIIYVTHKNNESISIISNGKTMICDFSNGGYTTVQKSVYAVENVCSTEIEGYVITHYHKLHISSFSKLTNNEIVRSLWVPYPQSDTDREVYYSLTEIAKNKGCDVYVYPLGSEVEFEDVDITVLRDTVSRSTHPVIGMIVEDERAEISYMSSSFWDADDELVKNVLKRRYPVIRGVHGPVVKTETEIDFFDLPCKDEGIYYMVLSEQGNS